MNQKCEKENNVINDHFIVEETRKINHYSAEQNRNHVQNSFFIFINNVHEERRRI